MPGLHQHDSSNYLHFVTLSFTGHNSSFTGFFFMARVTGRVHMSKSLQQVTLGPKPSRKKIKVPSTKKKTKRSNVPFSVLVQAMATAMFKAPVVGVGKSTATPADPKATLSDPIHVEVEESKAEEDYAVAYQPGPKGSTIVARAPQDSDREVLRSLGVEPDDVLATRKRMLEEAIAAGRPASVIQYLKDLLDQ